MLAQIQSDAALYSAAMARDGGQAFSTEILRRNLQRALPEAERRSKLATLEHRLATNPYDVEAQKLLEEEIARANIASNMELALEHMPEAFGSVHMLYVNAMVNNVPIRAFVDSGAYNKQLRCCSGCPSPVSPLLLFGSHPFSIPLCTQAPSLRSCPFEPLSAAASCAW